MKAFVVPDPSLLGVPDRDLERWQTALADVAFLSTPAAICGYRFQGLEGAARLSESCKIIANSYLEVAHLLAEEAAMQELGEARVLHEPIVIRG